MKVLYFQKPILISHSAGTEIKYQIKGLRAPNSIGKGQKIILSFQVISKRLSQGEKGKKYQGQTNGEGIANASFFCHQPQ